MTPPLIHSNLVLDKSLEVRQESASRSVKETRKLRFCRLGKLAGLWTAPRKSSVAFPAGSSASKIGQLDKGVRVV